MLEWRSPDGPLHIFTTNQPSSKAVAAVLAISVKSSMLDSVLLEEINISLAMCCSTVLVRTHVHAIPLNFAHTGSERVCPSYGHAVTLFIRTSPYSLL